MDSLILAHFIENEFGYHPERVLLELFQGSWFVMHDNGFFSLGSNLEHALRTITDGANESIKRMTSN